MVEAAHGVGLRTTSTVMFGHIDAPPAWAAHLAALRRLASQTHGISEFVPLPFVHMQAPIYLKGALPVPSLWSTTCLRTDQLEVRIQSSTCAAQRWCRC